MLVFIAIRRQHGLKHLSFKNTFRTWFGYWRLLLKFRVMKGAQRFWFVMSLCVLLVTKR